MYGERVREGFLLKREREEELAKDTELTVATLRTCSVGARLSLSYERASFTALESPPLTAFLAGCC